MPWRLLVAVSLVVPLLWGALFASPGAAREDTPSPSPQSPPRIVAIGDIHGAFEAFRGILQTAGVIDAAGQWSGGTTIFVQTGDIFDRGGSVRDALDLLMRLESDAKRAGGRVEQLMGNHEFMNLLGEFRDVSPAVYAAFADGRSADRQKRAYDDYVRMLKRNGRNTVPARDEWNKTHPPGFVEYSEAIGPRGKYGRWLRSKQVIATIGRTAFMHAGVDPASDATADSINRTAERELSTFDEAKAQMVQAQLVPAFATLADVQEAAVREVERIAAALKSGGAPGEHVTRAFVDNLRSVLAIGKSPLLAPEGPLWYRGFAQWPDSDEAQAIAITRRFDVDRFVTGHTPSTAGRIRSRFGNRLFLIDTGMLSTYFKGGRASALEIAGDRITAIYGDAREVFAPRAAAR